MQGDTHKDTNDILVGAASAYIDRGEGDPARIFDLLTTLKDVGIDTDAVNGHITHVIPYAIKHIHTCGLFIDTHYHDTSEIQGLAYKLNEIAKSPFAATSDSGFRSVNKMRKMLMDVLKKNGINPQIDILHLAFCISVVSEIGLKVSGKRC